MAWAGSMPLAAPTKAVPGSRTPYKCWAQGFRATETWNLLRTGQSAAGRGHALCNASTADQVDLPGSFVTICESSHRTHNPFTSDKLATLGPDAEPAAGNTDARPGLRNRRDAVHLGTRLPGSQDRDRHQHGVHRRPARAALGSDSPGNVLENGCSQLLLSASFRSSRSAARRNRGARSVLRASASSTLSDGTGLPT